MQTCCRRGGTLTGNTNRLSRKSKITSYYLNLHILYKGSVSQIVNPTFLASGGREAIYGLSLALEGLRSRFRFAHPKSKTGMSSQVLLGSHEPWKQSNISVTRFQSLGLAPQPPDEASFRLASTSHMGRACQTCPRDTGETSCWDTGEHIHIHTHTHTHSYTHTRFRVHRRVSRGLGTAKKQLRCRRGQ
jgi:hypothetical protein